MPSEFEPDGLRDGGVGDEEFLDDVLDRVTTALARRQQVRVEDFVSERPYLESQIEELVHLASDVAVVTPEALPSVPGYDLLRELGRGGMGTVYLARQIALASRLVALKVLPHNAGLSKEARIRFRNEALAIARIRHRSVVEIFEVLDVAGVPAYAMEWIDGRSLLQLVDALRSVDLAARPQRLSRLLDGYDARSGYFDTVAAWCLDIADALCAVHAAGFLHRDVKPSNILIRTEGTPVLTDFGVVRDEAASIQTRTGAFLGTPSYAAPEQLVGGVVDERTDVYGLGVTMYHALTGRVPFTAPSSPAMLRKIEGGDFVPPRKLEPKLPKDLETIVLACMDAVPARRYATCADVRADLGRYLEGRTIRARPASTFVRVLKTLRRNRSSVVGAFAGAALVLLFGIVTIQYVLDRAAIPGRVDELVRRARLVLLDPSFDEKVSAALYGRGTAARHTRYALRHVFDEALPLYDDALELRDDATLQAERAVVQASSAALDGLAVSTRALAISAPLTTEFISTGERVDVRARLASASTLDRRCLGLHALLSGRYDLCIDAWRGFDLARTEDPFVDAALGQVYWQSGRPALAWPRLERASRHFDEAGFLRVRLADAALRCGDAAYALRTIRDAATLDNFGLYGARHRVEADALIELGRVDEAAAIYARIEQRGVLTPMAHASLARFHERNGNYEYAVRRHRWARLVRWPNFPGVVAELGAALDAWWATLDAAKREALLMQSLDAPGTFLDYLLAWYARRDGALQNRTARTLTQYEVTRHRALAELAMRVSAESKSLAQMRESSSAAKTAAIGRWLRDASSDDVTDRERVRVESTDSSSSSNVLPIIASHALVSRAIDGGLPNGACYEPSLSADGRFVAFVSDASNLVVGDRNRAADVFVRDLEENRTIRVVPAIGTEPDGPSIYASISANGRFVAFHSLASNLIEADDNETWDCFVLDRESSQVTCVSIDEAGTPCGVDALAAPPSISADGDAIAYCEAYRSAKLPRRLVLFDRKRQRVRWRNTESVDDARCFGMVLPDGESIAYTMHVRVHEEPHPRWAMPSFYAHVATCSVRPLGTEHGRIPDFTMRLVGLTSTHAFVQTRATNLVTIDEAGTEQLFACDLAGDRIQRISVDENGRGFDVAGSSIAIIGTDLDDAEIVIESQSQLWILHGSSRRLLTGGDRGSGANGASRSPSASADGRVIVFESEATNLVPDTHDQNAMSRIYCARRRG
ncbi:MAG: protein kinase [Planctomycetes bacterium]|nr:protein kinase [Planctomycetota bacterium]MCB9892686.1 protein kinase [Planctomycetota bacterium]MCB9919093.1 protein kinase [Planctomycetota bacterium]